MGEVSMKTVDQRKLAAPCKGCDFLGLSTLTCDYILMTKKCRPCPPGKGCTEKSTKGSKSKLDHDKRLLELYLEGKNDVELANLTGYHIGSIRNWRKRNHYPPVVKGNPRHKHKRRNQNADRQ